MTAAFRRALGTRGAELGLFVNAYSLLEDTTRMIRRGERPGLDGLFGSLRALGVHGVRTLAHSTDATKRHDSVQWTDSTTRDAASDEALVELVESAARHDLSLALVLGNAWADYGGLPSYVAWAGHSYATAQDRRFYRSERAMALFLDHVTATLALPVGGVPLGRHPTVALFDLLNEPRVHRRDLGVYQAFVERLAQRSALLTSAPRLIGSEGSPRVARAQEAVETAALELSSLHLYPASLGLLARWPSGAVAAGRRALAHCPSPTRTFVGELGVPQRWPSDVRRDVLRRLLSVARRRSMVGVALWNLSPEGHPASRDPHTFDLAFLASVLRSR